MRTVYKYALEVTDEQDLDLPTGAEILHIGPSPSPAEVWLWALVDPGEDVPKEPRHIVMHGTGHPITKDGLEYLGTVQTSIGLVWHVFAEEVRF